MSTFKTKSSLRTIEAQIVQKVKNNEARPKFTGSYKKKSVYSREWHWNNFGFLCLKGCIYFSLYDLFRDFLMFLVPS